MNRYKVTLVLIPAVVLTILVLESPLEKASSVHTNVISNAHGSTADLIVTPASNERIARIVENLEDRLTDVRVNSHDVQVTPTAAPLDISDLRTIDLQERDDLRDVIFVNFDTPQELKVISRTFSATAGTSSEIKTIRLTSTQFPVTIHAIYEEANSGTGTTAISNGESIKFDKLSVNGKTVIDSGNVPSISGSNTEGTERVLLSEKTGGTLEDVSPLVIDSDLEMRFVLNSVGSGAGDPDNGFNFTVIAVVMAPESASVTLS